MNANGGSIKIREFGNRGWKHWSRISTTIFSEFPQTETLRAWLMALSVCLRPGAHGRTFEVLGFGFDLEKGSIYMSALGWLMKHPSEERRMCVAIVPSKAPPMPTETPYVHQHVPIHNHVRSRFAEVLFASVAGKMGLRWKAALRGPTLRHHADLPRRIVDRRRSGLKRTSKKCREAVFY